MRREGSACMGCGLNTRVQSPIAAPGRATWCKANAWRSAIDRLKGAGGGGEEMDGVCMLERLQWIAWQPGAYKTPLLIPLFHIEIPLPNSPAQKIQLHLYPLATFVIFILQ